MFVSSDPVLVSAATCDSPGSGTNTDAVVPVSVNDVMLTGGDPAVSVLWLIWLEISVLGLPAGNSLNEPALLITYPVPPPDASARYTGLGRICGVVSTVSPLKSTNVSSPGEVEPEQLVEPALTGQEIAIAYFVG